MWCGSMRNTLSRMAQRASCPRGRSTGRRVESRRSLGRSGTTRGGTMTTEPVARPTPVVRRSRQDEMYRRASRIIPGGADSNFRAWGEDTVYVDRGKGGLVWDIDGNEFVD